MRKVSALPTTQNRFNGYSEKQVADILNAIGTAANLMDLFAANPSNDDEITRQVLAQLAQRIGVLADMANPQAIWPGPGGWLIGPNFDTRQT
jgi:hypothetical protein